MAITDFVENLQNFRLDLGITKSFVIKDMGEVIFKPFTIDHFEEFLKIFNDDYETLVTIADEVVKLKQDGIKKGIVKTNLSGNELDFENLIPNDKKISKEKRIEFMEALKAVKIKNMKLLRNHNLKFSEFISKIIDSVDGKKVVDDVNDKNKINPKLIKIYFDKNQHHLEAIIDEIKLRIGLIDDKSMRLKYSSNKEEVGLPNSDTEN